MILRIVYGSGNVIYGRTTSGGGGGICLSGIIDLSSDTTITLQGYDYGTHSGQSYVGRIQAYKLD